jgi:hypothetical protein
MWDGPGEIGGWRRWAWCRRRLRDTDNPALGALCSLAPNSQRARDSKCGILAVSMLDFSAVGSGVGAVATEQGHSVSWSHIAVSPALAGRFHFPGGMPIHESSRVDSPWQRGSTISERKSLRDTMFMRMFRLTLTLVLLRRVRDWRVLSLWVFTHIAAHQEKANTRFSR